MANLNVRRDRHDIAGEILQAAQGGMIKTRLMYSAKLNYGQFTEYIPRLLEKGFLENVTVADGRESKHVLKTTEKGRKFLENLRSLEPV